MTARSNPEKVAIAVTGTSWMGGGIGSVQSAIEELLDGAESEIQMAIYELSSGAEKFLDRLQTCLARGVRVTMIVNRYQDKSARIRRRLEDMENRFPYFELLNFRPEKKIEDLHAKILVVDRRKALIGSANLTWKGLVGNHELAVVVSGSTAYTISELMDKLRCDPRIAGIRVGK